MSLTRTIIWIAPTYLLKGPAALLETSCIQPEHPFDWGWATEAKWVLGVESVTGSPTTWSLAAKFEYCVPNLTGGRREEERWFEVDSTTLAVDVAEGINFNTFTQADTLPATQKRTITNFGSYMRLHLYPTFTGGTSPGLYVSLTTETKGA